MTSNSLNSFVLLPHLITASDTTRINNEWTSVKHPIRWKLPDLGNESWPFEHHPNTQQQTGFLFCILDWETTVAAKCTFNWSNWNHIWLRVAFTSSLPHTKVICSNEKSDEGTILLTWIRELLGLNPGWGTDHPGYDSSLSSHSHKANSGIVPKIGPRPLPHRFHLTI